ncbi:MAG: hypothetical protein JWQ87_2220 [Candidatus Sulfotelmatobacter sp.]|nr:hypothetical protein [Candidatus Sulfotelmatobacter sp.]
MATQYQKFLYWLGFRKPIALELAEACAAVQGLRKEGYNEEEDFHYLKILDLANQLRAELLPRGIVIIPNDVECVETTYEVEGQILTAIRIKTEFQVTDGKRSLVKASYGSARNGNYAVAVAQTMALKSLLKRLGLIFGDEADAEAQRWAPWPGEKQGVRNYQERALSAALKTCGLTRAGVEALLSKVMGFPITCEGIVALPRKDFDIAMKAITKSQDLAEVLELSKRDAEKSRGPQRVVAVMDAKRDEIGAD